MTDQAESNLNALQEQIAITAEPLLQICIFAGIKNEHPLFPCGDFLRKLNMESTRIQELIDSYGVQKNEEWFPFREAVAAAKTFSAVHYNLQHIQKSSKSYNLLDIDYDFITDIENISKKLTQVVVRCCENLQFHADHNKISPVPDIANLPECTEEYLPMRFPSDRKGRHVQKVGETVVYLATEFLNLSEQGTVKELLRKRKACDFDQCIPDIVTEEKCRLVEIKFHNLQSMYDTYLFESDLEIQNKDLPFLRGHVSMIYHLLEIATGLIHYYIRHMSKLRRDTYSKMRFPILQNELLIIIFDSFLRYADLYMQAAKELCRSMIRHYSEEAEISVAIPNYRGFHVRPSTLIAKIVAHYGSKVKMLLKGQQYDAGVTLELFRANESINAEKRRSIAEVLNNINELRTPIPSEEDKRTKELQILFLNLMNRNEIILYDNNLSFHDLEPGDDENMAAFASRYMKHFMSIAKIDVHSDLQVRFTGDNRALKDLKILAENGYGEDKYGNNIVLPEELSYLQG